MNIEVIQGDITTTAADGILVGICEDAENLASSATDVAVVDKLMGGAIKSLVDAKGIKGKRNEVTVLHTVGRLPSRLVAVCGMGTRDKISTEAIRDACAEGCRALRKAGCSSVAAGLMADGDAGLSSSQVAAAMAEGAVLGLYTFSHYKKPEMVGVESVSLLVQDANDLTAVRDGVITGTALAEAANMARDMVNEPANYMTPSRMAEIAVELGAQYGFKTTVLDTEEMRTLGMGALLGVASGSAQPPKFIRMDYRGGADTSATIGLIGKAITFDSGGISIKPSQGLEAMKGDMAGGASVIAAMSAIARMKLPVNVTGLVPATENLLGSAAYRPGDVVQAMNGKTIEVISTDAEGRLALADAISYAVKEGLTPLIDVATLTGACQIALGNSYSGMFSNNQELADRIIKAAAVTGERTWQLPLADEYRELNKSLIADIKNVGNRYGGAITAALFLSEFAGDVPWVHLDIAGTSDSTKESGVILKGATGVPMRTLYEFVRCS
ncbi:MAG: leucyl aminopeptidase [Dehalococcoidia bacterium]|nr:leucyl aminopeptidase [Dehalococcoidia bacterium]